MSWGPRLRGRLRRRGRLRGALRRGAAAVLFEQARQHLGLAGQLGVIAFEAGTPLDTATVTMIDVVNPMAAVAADTTSRPGRIRILRPCESDSLPAAMIATTFAADTPLDELSEEDRDALELSANSRELIRERRFRACWREGQPTEIAALD